MTTNLSDAGYDLLDILADDRTLTSDYEWRLFLDALAYVATGNSGIVYPNELRPRLSQISPARRGAFTRRAKLAGILEPTGSFQESDDHGARNGGKASPVHRLRWNAWADGGVA